VSEQEELQAHPQPGVWVGFCGERRHLQPGEWIVIGREADLCIDDNPYLHRRFLQVGGSDGLWWLVNVGEQLSATVVDAESLVQAWLAPGARLPLVFEHTVVRFTAGPTTYELDIEIESPTFLAPPRLESDTDGETTVGAVALTPDQRALIVSLAEPLLLQEGRGSASVPSSAAAAQRLGWPITKFNRKLDNVCQKLSRRGVPGLHGRPGELASNRRGRLVEYAVSTRLVTSEDLALLDRSTAVEGEP
jgi:hypothetical protein